PKFSPDVRWIAYVSNESGNRNLYVQSFPQPGLKLQVSTKGAIAYRWRTDGKELFYLAPDLTLMAVPINADRSTMNVGAPTPLFQSSFDTFFVSPDGRFLMAADPVSPLTVILNWSATLRK